MMVMDGTVIDNGEGGWAGKDEGESSENFDYSVLEPGGTIF